MGDQHARARGNKTAAVRTEGHGLDGFRMLAEGEDFLPRHCFPVTYVVVTREKLPNHTSGFASCCVAPLKGRAALVAAGKGDGRLWGSTGLAAFSKGGPRCRSAPG